MNENIYTCFFKGNEPHMVKNDSLKAKISDDKIWENLKSCFIQEDNGKIACDAAKVQELFFHGYEGCIFISHSHGCEGKIHGIKNLIELKAGVSCFVDGDVWANAYKIRDEIANAFAYDEQESVYIKEPYDRVSRSVYFILLRALQEVIRASYAFVYVPPRQSIGKCNLFITESPWISEELFTSALIPIVANMEKKARLIKEAKYSSLKFLHPADISHLEETTIVPFIQKVNNMLKAESPACRKGHAPMWSH